MLLFSSVHSLNRVHRALKLLCCCSSHVDVNTFKAESFYFSFLFAAIQKQHDRNSVAVLILYDGAVCAHSVWISALANASNVTLNAAKSKKPSET